ncbi:hypothetical protein DPMN_145641 [Dreissena polymorpha]|uniref:Uncharacterized protein n=1 Tax=Dreissena polymorpha TaxID=45954 RepID=A0A9D4F8Y7_DREPO|nr:hypothetical protein DPMN_145641 [Dreissena polymorpha]
MLSPVCGWFLDVSPMLIVGTFTYPSIVDEVGVRKCEFGTLGAAYGIWPTGP